jgi:hypothetical protein
MDKQSTTKMPKPFDSEDGFNSSTASGNQQQFVLREDDRLKQEEDYRQGKYMYIIFSFKLSSI